MVLQVLLDGFLLPLHLHLIIPKDSALSDVREGFPHKVLLALFPVHLLKALVMPLLLVLKLGFDLGAAHFDLRATPAFHALEMSILFSEAHSTLETD